MRRSPEQLEAWRRLSPRVRRMLLSHRPDFIEQDEIAARATLRALERRFGPRIEPVRTYSPPELESGDEPEAAPELMPWSVIAAEIGVSIERARQIAESAMRKLRANPIVFELHFGERPRVTVADIDLAILVARKRVAA